MTGQPVNQFAATNLYIQILYYRSHSIYIITFITLIIMHFNMTSHANYKILKANKIYENAATKNKLEFSMRKHCKLRSVNTYRLLLILHFYLRIYVYLNEYVLQLFLRFQTCLLYI